MFFNFWDTKKKDKRKISATGRCLVGLGYFPTNQVAATTRRSGVVQRVLMHQAIISPTRRSVRYSQRCGWHTRLSTWERSTDSDEIKYSPFITVFTIHYCIHHYCDVVCFILVGRQRSGIFGYRTVQMFLCFQYFRWLTNICRAFFTPTSARPSYLEDDSAYVPSARCVMRIKLFCWKKSTVTNEIRGEMDVSWSVLYDIS